MHNISLGDKINIEEAKMINMILPIHIEETKFVLEEDLAEM